VPYDSYYTFDMIPKPSFTHPHVHLLSAPTISVEEAARVLGIGRNSAYVAVREGNLPAIKIGRRVRISTAVLRRMLSLEDVA
jgi:excisionase family DNA binding protein